MRIWNIEFSNKYKETHNLHRWIWKYVRYIKQERNDKNVHRIYMNDINGNDRTNIEKIKLRINK